MKNRLPPLRYFVYVLGTVNAVMAALFAAWALIAGGPGLAVIIPVILTVSVAGAWAVVREFSSPA